MSRNILVLGGHGDIGSAIVEKFQKMGETVSAPQRNELDLSRIDSIQSYFKNHGDSVDVLVHSAGLNNPKWIEDITPDDLEKTLSVNATGFVWVVQHLLSQFKKKKEGHILAISSIYGSFSRPKRLPYSAAKHALNGIIKTLALELGPFNIKVNSLSPGFIRTKMTSKNNDEKTIRDFESKISLGRLGTPSEIAEISSFLCAPQNTFIHGQDIIADGGYSIGGFQGL